MTFLNCMYEIHPSPSLQQDVTHLLVYLKISIANIFLKSSTDFSYIFKANIIR
jgi:hypothetical protein